jgi:hypothetical protein
MHSRSRDVVFQSCILYFLCTIVQIEYKWNSEILKLCYSCILGHGVPCTLFDTSFFWPTDTFLQVIASSNMTNFFISFQTIDYSSPRGGITVLTSSLGRRNPSTSSSSTSTLLISSVKPSDSGKYSCQPANAEMASVTVHILDGELSKQLIFEKN